MCVADVQRNSSLTANMSRVLPSFSSSLALDSSFLTESLACICSADLEGAAWNLLGKVLDIMSPSLIWEELEPTASRCREEEREIQEGNYRWAEREMPNNTTQLESREHASLSMIFFINNWHYVYAALTKLSWERKHAVTFSKSINWHQHFEL